MPELRKLIEVREEPDVACFDVVEEGDGAEEMLEAGTEGPGN